MLINSSGAGTNGGGFSLYFPGSLALACEPEADFLSSSRNIVLLSYFPHITVILNISFLNCSSSNVLLPK